jgi:hypothetical protein
MKGIPTQLLVLLPILCSTAAACPMCRDSTAAGGSGGNPPAALFNASVLWILGGFLLVAGFLIWKIAGAIWNIETSHRAAAGPQTLPAHLCQSISLDRAPRCTIKPR